MRRPDYGIDAPVMQRNMVILGLACIALFFIYPKIGYYSFWPGITFLLCTVWLRWGSRVGKIGLANKLVSQIPWRGDEQVLDVGCGHGLMTICSAKRLRTGKAIGSDIWREFDQAQNKPEKVMDNASIEGVGRLVEVKDADARELPYPDKVFDVVLSTWAIHNIAVVTGREKAISEMYRVLNPGGWLGIADIEATSEYQATMKRLGMTNIRRFGPNFCFIYPTYSLIGQKPGDPGT